MKSKTFSYSPITLISLMLLASICPAQAQTTSQTVRKDQTIIILDDSYSMRKHWEKVVRDYPKLVDRRHSRSSLGVLSVGSDCGWIPGILSGGWRPTIHLPIGSDFAQVRAAADSTIPHGGTYLNAALLHSVSLFQAASGPKRIVIISDGLNTCLPFMSTCEIARMLHQDYGIVIDIIAWAADPTMVEEFECVSTATNGSFIKLEDVDGLEPLLNQTPTPVSAQATAAPTIKEPAPAPSIEPISTPSLESVKASALAPISSTIQHVEPKREETPVLQNLITEPSYFSMNLWRYVVLALGACTLAFGSIVLYRHAFHVLGVRSRMARIISGLLIILGDLALYLVLFLNSEILSALIGAALLLAVIWLAAYYKPRRTNAGIDGASFIGVALGFLLFFTPTSAPGQQEAAERPRRHHVIAIDGSGSAKHNLEKMKTLCVRYAEVFTRPGEEVTLLIFGADRGGSVKEIDTFTSSLDRSAETMRKLLGNVAIQNPAETRTYFNRLGEFLKDFLLQKVRLDPILIVISDGKSDDYNDLPFKSFGPDGFYTAPGVTDLLVAVQGGNLDLTPLFEQPIIATPKPFKGIASPDSSPIPSCFFEPDLQLKPSTEIALRRNIWNPFSNEVTGELILDASNCASRFLSFSLHLQLGKEMLDIGRVNHLQIGPTPKSLSFPIAMSSIGRRSIEATLAIRIEQGGITRTVYAEPAIMLRESGYWSEFKWLWLAVAAALTGIGGISLFAAKRRHRRMEMRAEIITVVGGGSLSVKPGDVFTLGGLGCDLVASGIFDHMTLAIAEKLPQPQMLTLRAEDGYRMKINHSDAGTEASYQLGQRVQFCNASSGQTWEITLHAGRSSDLNLGSLGSISNNKQHGISAFDKDHSFINGNAQSGPII